MWKNCSKKTLFVIGTCVILLNVARLYGNERSGPADASIPIPEQYFGQPAPGETPVLFAPAILNAISPWVEATELSPDGTMFFVGVGNASYTSAHLYYSKYEGGAWTPFTDAPFLSGFGLSHEPVFSPNGDTLTFTGREVGGTNDLWTVDYTAGVWGTPVSLPAPINSSGQEWRGSRMSDGTLYFGSTRAIPGNNQIFKAYKDGSLNTVVELLGAPINNGTYEGDPCIAPDGHYMVFNSGRNGASTDLFVSFKNSLGGWGTPINLGSSFNSSSDEYGAHLSHDGKYLFYTRHTTTGNKIYWVAVSAIEKLAPPTATVLQFVGSTVTDSIGNHDGRAQAGETILLTTTISNAGLDAVNISGSLSSADPYVTIMRGTTTYPDLVWKGQGVSTTPFAVSIDPACPNPHIAVFTLATTSASGGGFSDTILVFVGDKIGFNDDMEGGEEFWRHKSVSSGYAEQWHRETSRFHSSANSWKMGGTGSVAYVDKCDAGLYSPPFLVPDKPKLTLWHRIDAEQLNDSTAWDGAVVMISTGSGQWTALHPVGGYPYKLNLETTLPAGTRCFSGSHDWTKVEFNLASYPGVRQIMFRFSSDGATTSEGWYIDDIRVSGCCEGTTGNVNMAGAVDLADLSALVSYLTGGGYTFTCVPEANVNGAGAVDLADLSALVAFLTGGGYTLPTCP
ncbi:MAG: hypothetical protein WAU88_03170 [Candidatus Zixiibacteriota bacterium]